jgi:hypothetical protein
MDARHSWKNKVAIDAGTPVVTTREKKKYKVERAKFFVKVKDGEGVATNDQK